MSMNTGNTLSCRRQPPSYMNTWKDGLMHLPTLHFLTSTPYLDENTTHLEWEVAEDDVVYMYPSEFGPRISRNICRKVVRVARRERRIHEKSQEWTPFLLAVRDEMLMRRKDW